MVVVKPDEAKYLKEGYSLYDPQTFIRFDDSLSKITRENIVDIASLVNGSSEPDIVKRTSLNLLKKYVLSSKKNRGRVMIRDKEMFYKTITYYARVINGLPTIKPRHIHKGFKEFMIEYMSNNPELKKKFMRNRFEPQNLIYSTLLKTFINDNNDLEFHAYRTASFLGKLFKQFGYFTTKPQLSVAVMVFFIARKYGYPSSVKRISKLFMTSDAYIMVLAKRHKDRLEKMWNALPEEDKKMVLESIELILKRVHS